jgi:hypothetical protein
VVVALVAAGITAVLLRGGHEGGADSPQAAVLNFLAAAEKNDAFAAADLLDPSEQDGVRKVLDNAHNTAEHTGYQKGGGQNGLLQGLNISTDDVQTTVTKVRDDLARVTITGGQITISFDPAKSNPGVRDLISDKDQRDRTWTADDLVTTSHSGEKLDPAVMTVRRSGKWYVSVMYSYVDAAARDHDIEPADPGSIGTESYDSPEDAAKGFVDGLAAMFTNADVMDVAKTLSPEGGTLLATYRKLFERNLKRHSVEVVGTPEFTSKTSGNTATIKVDDLTVQYTDDDGDVNKVRFHGGCITADHDMRCGAQGLWLANDFMFSPQDTGVIATKGDKGWHIDPVATYLNSAAQNLHDATPQDVALVLAESFGAPKAFLRLDAQEQLSLNGSKSVTLKKGGLEGLGYAIFDVPVHSGDQVTVEVEQHSGGDDSSRRVAFIVVGGSGRLAQDYSSSYEYGLSARDSFSATDTETVKLVVWGPADQSVSVSVRD